MRRKWRSEVVTNAHVQATWTAPPKICCADWKKIMSMSCNGVSAKTLDATVRLRFVFEFHYPLCSKNWIIALPSVAHSYTLTSEFAKSGKHQHRHRYMCWLELYKHCTYWNCSVKDFSACWLVDARSHRLVVFVFSVMQMRAGVRSPLFENLLVPLCVKRGTSF